jgi:hypothetical protein
VQESSGERGGREGTLEAIKAKILILVTDSHTLTACSGPLSVINNPSHATYHLLPKFENNT